MIQILISLLIFCLLSFSAIAEISLSTQYKNSFVKFYIQSTESLVVIGFEGQQEVRDYLFCRMQDCACEDMVSRGPRSHPKINSIQLTSNVQCIDQITMTFERIDNGFKPYIWNNVKSEQDEKPMEQRPQTRIAASATTYTDSDMTASLNVSSELTLKWKFNTDDTFDMCVILAKKAWVGVGFGGGMNGVDMFAINIIDDVPEILDLYSTSQSLPPTDAQNDYILISYQVSDNAVNARLQRKLNTGDKNDKVLTKGSNYTWCYASSSALTMENHFKDVQVFSVTFTDTVQNEQNSTTYTDDDMTASKTVSSSLVLKWKFNTDDTFDMCVSYKKKAWIGIGFGKGMKNIDMFAINIVNNVPQILDLFSTRESTPPADDQNDYTLISYNVTANSVNVRFQRKLNTGDSQDKTLSKGSSYTWSFATSSSLTMENHQRNVQEFSIKFSETGSQSSSNSNLLYILLLVFLWL